MSGIESAYDALMDEKANMHRRTLKISGAWFLATLVVLRLAHVISWSWWWVVTSYFWGPFAMFGAVAAVTLIAYSVLLVISSIFKVLLDSWPSSK